MKERSVEFYKKLILGTAAFMVVALVLIICILVGRNLKIFNSEEVQGGTLVGQEQQFEDSEQDAQSQFDELNDYDAISKEQVLDEETVLEKMVYLTFDDGATANTGEILDILKAKQVPATFFFKTTEKKTSDEIIKRAYNEGHAIGVLTSTDNSYAEIFKSTERYTKDLEASYDRIKSVTGEAPEVLRFPGGSRSSYTRNIYNEMIKIVEEKGLVYFDWTNCADKGLANMSTENIIANGTKLSEDVRVPVLLLHDNGNHNVCEALDEIIDFYIGQGYTFGKLTSKVEPITF